MGHRLYKPFEMIQKCADKLAIIAVNGPRPEFSSKLLTVWNGCAIRLCTDGAADALVEPCRSGRAKNPELIVGDFDSIGAETKKFFAGRENCQLQHETDQNSTDLTKTLNALMGRFEQTQIDGILLLGGFTGRFDHVLGTLNAMLLQIQSKPDLPVYAVDGQNMITVLPQGEAIVQLSEEHVTGTCGLLPIVQKRTVVSTEGLRWDLKETEIEYGHLVSTSNHMVRPQAVHIRSNQPLVFTFELREPDGIV